MNQYEPIQPMINTPSTFEPARPDLPVAPEPASQPAAPPLHNAALCTVNSLSTEALAKADALPHVAGPPNSALCTLNSSLPKRPRNGKIARLPKPVRDLVNRMLFN